MALEEGAVADVPPIRVAAVVWGGQFSSQQAEVDSEGVLEEVLVEDGVASAGECRVEAAPVEVGSGSW